VEHKKATHAVVCETLRRLPAIRAAAAAAGLLDAHPRLTPATAFVLAYEVMFGQVRPSRCLRTPPPLLCRAGARGACAT
jgi:hypothetical protein